VLSRGRGSSKHVSSELNAKKSSEGTRGRRVWWRLGCVKVMLRCGRRVCAMKIVSCNIRGLGGFEKRDEVNNLVVEKKLSVLFIQ